MGIPAATSGLAGSRRAGLSAALALSCLWFTAGPAASEIVHDAEYYILEAQNGKVWAVEDGELDKKLAELREEYGTPPNIVHFMWDDQPFGAVGIPEGMPDGKINS